MTTLLLETIDEEAMTVLEDIAPVMLSPTPNAHAHDLPFDVITAIVTRGLGQLDRALIEKCPNLKVIARCGAGLNNLDLIAAAENQVQVIFAPGINATSVAEHTLMLMLMAVRSGFITSTEVKQGNWNCRNEFGGDDLTSKKICIIGGGNIGQKTADLCHAFSMDVIICGRDSCGAKGLKAALEQHLPSSDIVSLHIPLTEETHQLINQNVLALFKPGAILINTARGELVHKADLIKTLDNGHLTSYAADVVEGETPVSGDILVSHPHSIVTPHVAAMTRRTYREMCLFTAINVASALTGNRPAPVSVYQGAI